MSALVSTLAYAQPGWPRYEKAVVSLPALEGIFIEPTRIWRDHIR